MSWCDGGGVGGQGRRLGGGWTPGQEAAGPSREEVLRHRRAGATLGPSSGRRAEPGGLRGDN